MPTPIPRKCGAALELRDEFAGHALQCPACQRPVTAPAVGVLNYAGAAGSGEGDEIFGRDKFLLRQKLIAINDRYSVFDEQNRPIVYVERPAHLIQNLGAAIAGLIAGVIVGGAIFLSAFGLFGENHPITVGAFVVGGVLGLVTGLIVGISLSAKRHVSFYSDEARSKKIFEILQDKKFQPITSTYTLRDADGQILAHLHKNILYNLFRKRWYCYAADGSLIFLAIEDSMLLAFLRRFLGTFYGLLRTNFIYVTPGAQEQIIGEFNRKFTLFDRYVLDLTADPNRWLDRRIALGMGVMLDTGERR